MAMGNFDSIKLGLICLTVMAIVAALILKADGKDVLIGAVGVIGGWLGHSATSGKDLGSPPTAGNASDHVA